MSVTALPGPGALIESKRSLSTWRVPRATRGTSVERASSDMLRLYRTNLEVRLQCVDELSLQTECRRHIYSAVEETLGAERHGRPLDPELEWNELHKAERLIAVLLSGAHLRQEIRNRLQDLAAEKPGDADRLRGDYEALLKLGENGTAPAEDDDALRAFLLRLMELLHRHEKEKYLARPIRKQATRNLLLCVLGTFGLLVLPYVLLTADYGHAEPDEVLKMSKWWSQFALYTALMSGLLGALFSRLLLLQRDWSTMPLDEVFLHRDWLYALLRAGFGMCAAFLVYFFLRAGVIDLAVFPKFDKLAIEFVQVPAPAAQMSFHFPSKDLALLTILCFVAGFSEVLVPKLLGKAERQMSDPGTPAKNG
jgi:hypothetical protein